MPDPGFDSAAKVSSPDYSELVKFLVKPFLELPESLKVDCEISQSKAKVWVRLAFEGSDKGRVFGRGGRNIQAIRTILETAALAAGYSAYLDIYGGAPQFRQDQAESDLPERPHPRRSAAKSPPRPRSSSL
jgi:predicted RNA-binding protein YlqC (UPF0109 family)